jgi:hypothetical protein
MNMDKSILLKSVLIAATLPLFAGCVTRVVYQPAPQDIPPPPAAQVEVVPVAPGPGFIWVGGEYAWGGGGWYWAPGHWRARPYGGAVWVHGGWGWRGHRRVWVGAHWR